MRTARYRRGGAQNCAEHFSRRNFGEWGGFLFRPPALFLLLDRVLQPSPLVAQMTFAPWHWHAGAAARRGRIEIQRNEKQPFVRHLGLNHISIESVRTVAGRCG